MGQQAKKQEESSQTDQQEEQLPTPQEESAPHIVTKPATEWLQVQFTDAEIRAFSREIAENYSRKGQLELDKKEMVKDMDARFGRCSSRINDLAQKITAGSESKNVKCEVVFDYDHCVKTCVRLDTGEQIWEVPLTGDELQRPLPFEEDKNQEQKSAEAEEEGQEEDPEEAEEGEID